MHCPGWIAQLQTAFVQIFLLVFGQTVETVVLDMDTAKFAVFNTSQIIEFEKLAVNRVRCEMIVLDAQLIQETSANILMIFFHRQSLDFGRSFMTNFDLSPGQTLLSVT